MKFNFSKSSVLIIILVVFNLLLFYKVNFTLYSVELKNNPLTKKNKFPLDVQAKLRSLNMPNDLNLVIFLNEQSCNYCNNQILMNVLFFSENHTNDIFLFIGGSEDYVKIIANKFETCEKIKIQKFETNSFINPICYLVDLNNKIIMELHVDTFRIDEANLFFERISLLFNAVNAKSKTRKDIGLLNLIF